MKSNKGSVQTPYTEEHIQRYLLDEKQTKNRSLRDLASEFEVSHGVIQRLLKGQFPKRKAIREKMNLSPLELVEICSGCGKVLTPYHRCHTNNKLRNRIAIRLDNPESAARSIEKHMEPGKIEQLIGLLREGK